MIRYSLSGNKDIDRKIILSLSLRDFLSVRILNKYFCDYIYNETVFKIWLVENYPNILKYVSHKNNLKRYSFSIFRHINLLEKDFDFIYDKKSDGNPIIQYKIFKDAHLDNFAKEFDNKEINTYVKGTKSYKLGNLLIKAVSEQEIHLIKMFKFSRADIMRGLNIACRDKLFDIALYLVEKGMYGNDQSLYFAAINGQIELVKKLVKYGANPSNGLIPAIINDRIDVVKCLVELGADINIDNEYPLRLALEEKKMEILDYLIQVKNEEIN